MRKVIGYFIKYPVAVNVSIIAIVVFGLIGANRVRSSFFPLLDSRIVTVTITYPGASPAEVEEGVVLKIEDNLKGLEGIERVTSRSYENTGVITVELFRGQDINVRLDEIKNAVDQVPNFPSGMEPLVIAEQKRTNEAINFALTGEKVSVLTLKEIGREIENDLRALESISKVTISGYPEEEIEIAVNEKELLSYNISFSDVAVAVSNANILVTGGNVKTDEEEYLIRADNRGYYATELLDIVVKAQTDGSKIKLRDIATVKDRFSEIPDASYFNGKRMVNFSVSTTNSEDLILASKEVVDYIEQFNQKYDVVSLSILRDRSEYINERTRLLMENAGMGILLVLVFLSLFLNTRLAFWVAFGLPISFLGLFIFAPGIGITVNILSLFGLIIVIGILVDDGIVIAENIYHHFEKGKSPIRAAIDGTLEVIPPIVSAITTTLLAFSIFLYLDSDIGQFFGEVAIVVIITLSVSLVEALIILPSHLAHSKALLHKKGEEEKGGSLFTKLFRSLRGINRKAEAAMNYIRDKTYVPAIDFILKHRFFSLSIFIFLFVLTVGSIGGGIIRVTLFPEIASTEISVNLRMPEGTNVKYADSIITMIEKKAWEVNEEFTKKQGDTVMVQNIVKTIGPGIAAASLSINLTSEEYRDFSSRELSNALRQKVGSVYGTESLTFNSGSSFGGSPVAVSLLGNNIKELKAAKVELKEAMSKIDLLKDISDSDPEGIKEIRLELKDNAYLLGLDLNTIMSQVRSGFFGSQVQRLQRGQDEIKVWVRYDRANRGSINDLDNMRIVTPSGERIPLREIVSYSIERGEVSINRLDGAREIQVTSDIKDSDAVGDVLENIRTNIIPEILSKYPSVKVSYEGQNRQAGKLVNSFYQIGPIILVLIFMTIAFTFRSYSQPFLLLSMIPLSLIGVAWGHWIHGFSLNALSLLGIIALIGITVNDGLVLISKLNSFLKEGMEFDKAIREAGKSRFRAIFLTSLTTIAGLAPLIMEKSRNAQFLIPMAISIAYGIAIATFLTLLVLPLLISLTNDFKVFFKWLVTGVKVSKHTVERAVIELEAEKTLEE
ncbi:MAG: efflux RND transporter permease subunit [Bacteroidota bacterium]